jgi:hypothetical protein
MVSKQELKILAIYKAAGINIKTISDTEVKIYLDKYLCYTVTGPEGKVRVYERYADEYDWINEHSYHIDDVVNKYKRKLLDEVVNNFGMN